MTEKLLIIRFSALGDVAMTVPVIYSLARQYPDLEITMMSRENFEPIFKCLPDNVRFKGIDLKQYDSISGLSRLYKELKTDGFDYIADFHSVLRTHYLRFRFKLAGKTVASIDKGRREKEKLTRKNGKVLSQLESSFVRYKKVLEKLGFQFDLNFQSIYGAGKADITSVKELTGEKSDNCKWLGIAPFAKHKGKIYPLELQEKVISHFAQKQDVKLFLFGGGAEEKQIVDDWVQKYPQAVSVIGKLNMKQELALLSNMNAVLSMDSANMHLASLVGTPVLSVWGATHPFAGFMGWGQPMDNAIQVDLDCRPCSVFGDKPCFRHDYACLYEITPEMIVERIEKRLIK